MSAEIVDHPILPCLPALTSILPSRTSSNLFPLSLKSALFYHLQSTASVSPVYTSQRLCSVPLCFSLPFNLHCSFLPPFHRDSPTMRTPPSQARTFFFACVSCLDFCLEEAQAVYRKSVFITKFLDYVIGKVETLSAAAPPFFTDSVQLAVPGTDLDRHQAFSVLGRLNENSKGRNFGVTVTVMARPDVQRRQILLRRMLTSLVEVPIVLCPFGFLIFSFLTDSGSVRSKGRTAVEIFRTSVIIQIEQVMYTFFIIIACRATNSHGKKKYLVEGRSFVASPVLNLHSLSERSAHRSWYSVQRIVEAWDQLDTSVGVGALEEPVQPTSVLQRPWARFGVLSDKREKVYVARD